MNFRTISDGAFVTDEVESGEIRFRVARVGAELISIARRRGDRWQGFLHRDGESSPPASGWANHATVMGYFLHRLWKEQSTYRGEVIRGGNHGFIRHFSFSEPRLLADGVVYAVFADDVPRAAYPLRVGFEIAYRIVNDAVRVEFSFTNFEPTLDAHVSFGLHPGFSVASVAEARVTFPAGRYERFFAPGNFLNGQTEFIDHPGGEMPFPKAGLPDSYLIGLEGVPNRHFVLESPGLGTSVGLDFSEVPFLTLWSDGVDFLCVEPCWGLPDSNPPVAFEQKLGIQVIPPGGTLQRGFSILPAFIP